MYKRLIMCRITKKTDRGANLIDDRTKNGAEQFKGEHIHFGTELFLHWSSVLVYLGVD